MRHLVSELDVTLRKVSDVTTHLEYLISSSTPPFMVSNRIKFDEDPRSNSLWRYCPHKVLICDPMWPWPLTPRPWNPKWFIYSSWWVYHVKFDEDPSTIYWYIAPNTFSYTCMTTYDIDLWPHHLKNLISSSTRLHDELPHHVWCKIGPKEKS